MRNMKAIPEYGQTGTEIRQSAFLKGNNFKIANYACYSSPKVSLEFNGLRVDLFIRDKIGDYDWEEASENVLRIAHLSLQ